MPVCDTCKEPQDRNWDVWLSDTDWAPEPPPLEGLQQVGPIPDDKSSPSGGYSLPYRCLSCGAWYVYRCKAEQLYLNQCAWRCSFRRLSPREAAGPCVRTRRLVGEGKLAELGGLLLGSDLAEEEKMEALEMLLTLCLRQLDLTPLEPTLRDLLTSPVRPLDFRDTSPDGHGWMKKAEPAVGAAPGDVVVGDLDGDGDRDMAVANFGNTVTVLEWTGSAWPSQEQNVGQPGT